MLPTLRSLPDPAALAPYLRDRYGIDFTGCTLLRSLVNDVYEVTTADARYILKLYRYGGRHLDGIRWETGLSAHLIANGLSAPAIRPLPDGDPVGLLDAPEGPRPFVLQEFVDGTKPPYAEELYRDFGVLVAQFHEMADSYVSEFPRRTADLSHSLDELRPQLAPAEENLLQDLADAVRNNLAQYSAERGICHGDVTLDNLLVAGNCLTLYDFDLAGADYRAADFHRRRVHAVLARPQGRLQHPPPDHGGGRGRHPLPRRRRADLQPPVPPGRQTADPRHRVPHRRLGGPRTDCPSAGGRRASLTRQ
ncbi:phosphotransferase enzyme family protein [Kribbella steppae]|uniref:phosphotransferase enzyme family protein n=1 Tax=Kribbella steppae TaxID=2512223 RepID=UPI00130DC6EE|nr:phosphotransferase [Kribbella steppae]